MAVNRLTHWIIRFFSCDAAKGVTETTLTTPPPDHHQPGIIAGNVLPVCKRRVKNETPLFPAKDALVPTNDFRYNEGTEHNPERRQLSWQ
jgi:hypothetical protein